MIRMCFTIFLVIISLSSPAQSVSSSCMNAYASAALTTHNQLRMRHGAPPLRLDSTLQQVAQAYAEKLAMTNSFEHSDSSYGENMAYNSFSSGNIDQTVCANLGRSQSQNWYAEISNYNFADPGFSMDTGHFTQLVWASSQRVGFGVATDSSGSVIYGVANYDPPGNSGDYDNNVHPLRGKMLSNYKKCLC